MNPSIAVASPGGAEGGALCIRGTDTNGTANHSPTYDAVGNMTDDGKAYKLAYDAFGRLRTIKDRTTDALLEEFRYSGLNHRIGWHYDSDGDSDVDANDTWYYFVYDRQWRMVATVRNGTANHSPTRRPRRRDRHRLGRLILRR